MAHASRDQHKLLARVRRIRGQVDAIERALTKESESGEILHLIAGVRGAMAGLMAEVVEDHVRNHLLNPQSTPPALDLQAAEQLFEVIRAYLK